MTALVRYVLAGLFRSQRYLAPALLFATMLVVLTTNESGSPGPVYAACALAQFVTMTWLTMVLVNTEESVQRAMTAVAAGGARRVLLADVCASVLLSCCLAVAGLVYPLLAGDHPVTPIALAIGVLAQLTGGLTGIAVGLLCSHLVVPRPGYALVAALLATGVLALVPWLPPVAALIRLLSTPRPLDGALAPTLGCAAIAAILLAAGTLTTWTVARNRG